LPDLLKVISGKTLFWLDGHFSGSNTFSNGLSETPISTEIIAVLNQGAQFGMKHVILVDDARCFDGENGYPTLMNLKNQIALIAPTYVLEVEDDIIRIH